MEEEGDVVYFEVSNSTATKPNCCLALFFSLRSHQILWFPTFLIRWSRLQTSPAAEQLKEAAGDMSTSIFTSSLNSKAPDTNDSTAIKQVLAHYVTIILIFVDYVLRTRYARCVLISH